MHKRRVLVVDDNVDAADSLAMLLEMWGHQVRVASHPNEAMQIAPDFLPEVALLDIGLPAMNGYELGQRLRSLPCCRQVALVALSGYTQDEAIQQAHQAGFDHYLVKPPEIGALQRLIDGI